MYNFKSTKNSDEIANKYDRLKIDTKPYIYLKANRGTYGMGIMVIHDAEEIFSLNKKLHNQMNTKTKYFKC